MKQTIATLMRLVRELENDPATDKFLAQQIYGLIASVDSVSGSDVKDSFIASATLLIANAMFMAGQRAAEEVRKVTAQQNSRMPVRIVPLTEVVREGA